MVYTKYEPVLFDMQPFDNKRVPCTKYQESCLFALCYPHTSAQDLAPRMIKRFFEVFGGRQPTVTLSALRARLKTATAIEVENHAGVRYEDVLSGFPANGNIDAQMLTSLLVSNAGKGTPLTGEDRDNDEYQLEPLVSMKKSLHAFLRGCGIMQED